MFDPMVKKNWLNESIQFGLITNEKIGIYEQYRNTLTTRNESRMVCHFIIYRFSICKLVVFCWMRPLF